MFKLLLARTMEEFLISGFCVHRKYACWKNDRFDCWTDYVQPNNFFIDSNMRDPRGWDCTMLGEIHDISFGDLCGQFAKSPDDYKRLKEIYRHAADKACVSMYADQFGYPAQKNWNFFVTTDPSRCRVIEVWKKEQRDRYRCYDPQNGSRFKIVSDSNVYRACCNLLRNLPALARLIHNHSVNLCPAFCNILNGYAFRKRRFL